MLAALSDFAAMGGQIAKFIAGLTALAVLIVSVSGLCWLGAVVLGVD